MSPSGGEGGVLLAGMTSPEVAAWLRRGGSTIVVPFGAVEQHGAHLPLDTDAGLGDRIGPLLAERLDALCAPTMRIGCSEHHLAFPGTLSLRPETLQMVVDDVVDSLARHGFRRIVLLPTHGGNDAPLAAAAATSRRSGVTVLAPSLRVVVDALLAVAQARGVSAGAAGAHAGELETSLMLALDDAAIARFFAEGVGAVSANGVLGDPRGASEDAGRAYVTAFLDAVERQIGAETPSAPA